jgi:hypothetical protein
MPARAWGRTAGTSGGKIQELQINHKKRHDHIYYDAQEEFEYASKIKMPEGHLD